MELVFSIFLGIGLAAACGFRIFLPLFAMCLFSYFDWGSAVVPDSFQWLGTIPALLTFGVASLVEVFAYYIPYVDNVLDTVAVPLATVAGTLMSFTAMVDFDPLLQWSIALIAGGGLAGLIKGSAAGTRALSTVTTGGVANPVVSTAETGGSLILTVLAVFVPVLAVLLIIVLLYFIIRFFLRRRKKVAEE